MEGYIGGGIHRGRCEGEARPCSALNPLTRESGCSDGGHFDKKKKRSACTTENN